MLSGIPGDNQDRSTIAKDVKASYKFLQDRLSSLSATVKQTLKRGNLFLNVDDHNAQWTWCSAADLILNANDDGPTYKMVRSSLKSYAKLLRALGVHTLDSVDKPEIEVTGVEGELRKLRGGFDAKRRAEIGIDVVFIDMDDTPGRHPAHKMFLSVCASFFDDQFYVAGMRESVNLSFAPLEVKVETSGAALRRALGESLRAGCQNSELTNLSFTPRLLVHRRLCDDRTRGPTNPPRHACVGGLLEP